MLGVSFREMGELLSSWPPFAVFDGGFLAPEPSVAAALIELGASPPLASAVAGRP